MPIIISHRGNINGPQRFRENNPKYIKELLSQNIPCEVDLRFSNKTGNLFLGHDICQYKIDQDFLVDNRNMLYIHCKTLGALSYLNERLNIINMNYFYHANDAYTLTSQKQVWCFPGTTPPRNGILVDLSSRPNYNARCLGVCVDWIE